MLRLLSDPIQIRGQGAIVGIPLGFVLLLPRVCCLRRQLMPDRRELNANGHLFFASCVENVTHEVLDGIQKGVAYCIRQALCTSPYMSSYHYLLLLRVDCSGSRRHCLVWHLCKNRLLEMAQQGLQRPGDGLLAWRGPRRIADSLASTDGSTAGRPAHQKLGKLVGK